MKKFLVLIAVLLLTSGVMTGMFVMTARASEKSSIDIGALLGDVKDKMSEAVSSMDDETVKEVFDFIKEKVQDGSLKSQDGLESAIKEGEDKFDVDISEADVKKVVEVMEKLEDMGFSGDYVIEKSEKLYQTYGADFVDHADEVIAGAVQNAVSNAAESFFHNLWESTKNFFKNLFGGL